MSDASLFVIMGEGGDGTFKEKKEEMLKIQY